MIMWSWKKYQDLLAFSARKVSKYGVISGPYFPAFGLNTEIYSVNLLIQSECRKIRSRNNSVFGHFSRSGFQLTWSSVHGLHSFLHFCGFSRSQNLLRRLPKIFNSIVKLNLYLDQNKCLMTVNAKEISTKCANSCSRSAIKATE